MASILIRRMNDRRNIRAVIIPLDIIWPVHAWPRDERGNYGWIRGVAMDLESSGVCDCRSRNVIVSGS